ncbi:MAG: WD40 repeat domain-containing protein [Treponema sp.]|jgi:hypothetical protein|nr:WD40 repeat domain-containing protein [Treponema sp.]
MKSAGPFSSVLYVFLMVLVPSLPAQSCGTGPANFPGSFQNGPAEGHRGPVRALASAKNLALSAGADGFLGVWDLRTQAALDRFQISPYALHALAVHPERPHAALVESDNSGGYWVSVWDYSTKQRLFTRRFGAPLAYIAYSAGGNFIILAQESIAGLVFLDAQTGAIRPSPTGFTGSVSFACTGKTERTMVSYSPLGILSYWNLESAEALRHLPVPPHIGSPVLFGNNRFLGGIDAQGLVILDAVSGNELAREPRIAAGSLYPAGQTGDGFFWIQETQVCYYVLDNKGALRLQNAWELPPDMPAVRCAAVSPDAPSGNAPLLLGLADGMIWAMETGEFQPLKAALIAEQLIVYGAEASGTTLGLLLDPYFAAFIPLDYTALQGGSFLDLEAVEPYTQLTAVSHETFPEDSFLFWQPEAVEPLPLIRGKGAFRHPLDALPLRRPLRSAASLGEQLLFLDSAGNICILSAPTQRARYSAYSAGALDAAFIDEQNIIIGRGALSANTPFQRVNVNTGETLALAYTAPVGARLYRGASGAVYGAVISGGAGTSATKLLRINIQQPAQSDLLAEALGEDIGFGIAEAAGNAASTLGRKGAVLYHAQGFIPFERHAGLPVRLISGGAYFITVDTGGSVNWYDAETAELRALLRIYTNEWLLITRNRVIAGKTRFPVSGGAGGNRPPAGARG